jgi:hypothetical protein
MMGKDPLYQYPILSEYKDVFSKELLGLPHKRELDFMIKIKPGAKIISKTPYKMMALGLCELQL